VKPWLVRHAQPLVEPSVCYGALDVAADAQATAQAAQTLLKVLPPEAQLITSPLRRCMQLAHAIQALRPATACRVDARLAEMNFGTWEGQRWDAIARAELDGWTQAFAHWRCGGGECVQDVMARVAAAWDDSCALRQPMVWITHAGVIRAASLLEQGRRHIDDASQWPQMAPAWGQWTAGER
jgi:alpha-ribazole phosphatase